MKQCAILLLASALCAGAAEPALKISMLETDVLCVRASRVSENFAEQFQSIQPAGRISGTVLDLRFAGGEAVNPATNLFSGRTTPLVILINNQTKGAAAALAAQLRQEKRGLIIGGTNAAITPDITVMVAGEAEKNYQDNPFDPAPEASPFRFATNDLVPYVDHLSEAELVSKRAKDGEFDPPPDSPRPKPSQPVIRDPALARAVDLLKALAVLPKPRG